LQQGCLARIFFQYFAVHTSKQNLSTKTCCSVRDFAVLTYTVLNKLYFNFIRNRKRTNWWNSCQLLRSKRFKPLVSIYLLAYIQAIIFYYFDSVVTSSWNLLSSEFIFRWLLNRKPRKRFYNWYETYTCSLILSFIFYDHLYLCENTRKLFKICARS
jgi:hypothetical protein